MRLTWRQQRAGQQERWQGSGDGRIVGHVSLTVTHEHGTRTRFHAWRVALGSEREAVDLGLHDTAETGMAAVDASLP